MRYHKALVTGGAGFIGSHLARALLHENMQVVVLDNLSMGKIENVPPGAVFIRGDVCNREDVLKALQDVDVVFHEAARVSIRSSVPEFFDDARTNLMGTLNLLRCYTGSGVKKLVFASSMAVYADAEDTAPISEDYTCEPLSPYGISKLAGEKYCLQLCRQMGIDCHVLRYFNTYGIGQAVTPYVGVITIFINRLLDHKAPVIYGDGQQRRDFIHISDVVSANLLAMTSRVRYGIFNIGTGIDTSVNEIADLLCTRIDPRLKPLHTDEQPGELRYSIADISRASRELGYQPKVKLADRIDEVIDYQRHRTLTQPHKTN